MEENLTELRATSQLLQHGRQELSKIIAGQTTFIDQALIVALCRGHALIEGVPGIAKTLVVKLLAHVLGLEFHRVQSTPGAAARDEHAGRVCRRHSLPCLAAAVGLAIVIGVHSQRCAGDADVGQRFGRLFQFPNHAGYFGIGVRVV